MLHEVCYHPCDMARTMVRCEGRYVGRPWLGRASAGGPVFRGACQYTAMIVKIQMTTMTTTTTTTTSDYFTVVLRACEGVTYLSPFSTAVPIYLGTNHSNSK